MPVHFKTFSGFHDGMYGIDAREIQEFLDNHPHPIRVIERVDGMLIIGYDDLEQYSVLRIAEIKVPTGHVWGGSSNIPQAGKAEQALNDWSLSHPDAIVQKIISDKNYLMIFYN